jgi:hypothetical protein
VQATDRRKPADPPRDKGARARARGERSNPAARRLLSIADARDGMSRADAATAAGMARPALRDAVLRYSA